MAAMSASFLMTAYHEPSLHFVGSIHGTYRAVWIFVSHLIQIKMLSKLLFICTSLVESHFTFAE